MEIFAAEPRSKGLQIVETQKLDLSFLLSKQILRNIRSRIFRTIAVVLKYRFISCIRTILHVTYLVYHKPFLEAVLHFIIITHILSSDSTFT